MKQLNRQPKRTFLVRAAMTLLMVLTTSTAWATDEKTFAGFTATGGTQSTTYVGYQDQGYDKLVDGDRNTKWCTFHPTTVWYVNGYASGAFFVDFHSDQAIIPTKYILTTGDDSQTWYARNPKSWIVKAKEKESDPWTVIANVENDTRLPRQNQADVTYDLDVVGKYKYFCFIVSKKVGVIEENVQLNEFRFVGYDNEYDMSTVTVSDLNTFSYNGGSAVSIGGYTVKDLTGRTMIEGTDYTVSYLKDGTAVSQVTAKGDYTLRLTGQGSYTGVKEVAFRVVDGLQGTGSSSSPFLIHNVDEWNLFALSVNHGNSYSSQYVKLEGDVDGLAYPAGNTAETSFKGTFLGNNHTMTLAMTSEGTYTAPFRYVEDATISGVRTAGTISTSRKYAAGLIGQTAGTVTLSNCVSSVTINSSIDGDGTHGGFVAIAGSGAVTFDNCLFKGAINGSLTTNCGGFVGWRNGTLTLDNCMMTGTMTLSSLSGSATFSRNNGSNTTLNLCYYLNACGTAQGLPMSATATGKLERRITALDGSQYYVPATFSGLQAKYTYDGTAVSPEPVVSCYGTTLTKGSDYTLSYANNDQVGRATVTVTGQDQYVGATALDYELVSTVAYRYYQDGAYKDGEKAANEYTPVTSGTTIMNGGWYAVNSDVTIGSRITVNGNVHLILTNGATLTAQQGIRVHGSNSLTIYGQSGDTGKLVARGDAGASIGSDEEEDEDSPIHSCGTITIHGGTIDAKNEVPSNQYEINAGIGQGWGSQNGVVTIYGGIIHAESQNAAGIGAAEWASKTITVSIYGGTITAVSDDGAGIGTAEHAKANVNIYGGKITASSKNNTGIKGSSISIGWTHADDYISANSYGDNVTFQDGKPFCFIENGVKTLATKDNIAGKTIVPYLLTVSFDANGGSEVEAQAVAYNTTATAPAAPTRDCYFFKNWKKGDSVYDFATAVTEDITLTAQWNIDPAAFFGAGNDGSAEKPYTITTIDGWNAFCDALQDNDTWNRFSGLTVQLGNDIGTAQQPVTRMAGSGGHDFMGTFDGRGHTLTVSYGSASQPVSDDDKAAPFRNVETGCTIKDLHVAGNIYTSKKYAGGLVGTQFGTVRIENCRVSTLIHSYTAGDGSHGGIVGHNGNSTSAKLTIEGCTFDGKLLSGGETTTTNCAGIVGYKHDAGTVTITNTLYAPATLADGETEIASGSATFVRNGSAGDNCYYTRTLGSVENQGKQAHTVTAGDNVTVGFSGDGTGYTVSGITAYATGIIYNNVCYAGPAETVSLTLDHSDFNDYTFAGYEANAGNLDGTTLTMPDDADVIIKAMWNATLFAEGSTSLWMTWCDSNEWLMPEGCAVYTIESVDNGMVMLIQLDDQTLIPANKPLIIGRSAAGTAVTANLNSQGAIGEDIATVEAQGGTFYGTTTALTADDFTPYYAYGQTYALYGGDFLLYDTNSGVPAHRCWLNVETASSARLTISCSETSSISEERRVKSEEFATAPWYTLDGRKLDRMPGKKGIYLNNGQKVVVK